MSSPVDQPCAPWASVDDVKGCGPCADASEEMLADALATSSAWLWRMTGKQYGICPVTVLPLGQSSCDPCQSGFWTWGSSWYFDRARNCWHGANGRYARNESRFGVPEIRLGFTNVQAVTQVAIDGEILDPAAYRVDDGRWLVRIDGGTWPHNQDVTVTPPEFQVTLEHGLPVPADGIVAATTLACEIVQACSGGKDCRLPKRVQTITRQGVSMVLMDPLTILDEGKFGIAEVDYFVKSVNPHGLRQRARVVSPDVPRQVRIPTSPMLAPVEPPP